MGGKGLIKLTTDGLLDLHWWLISQTWLSNKYGQQRKL